MVKMRLACSPLTAPTDNHLILKMAGKRLQCILTVHNDNVVFVSACCWCRFYVNNPGVWPMHCHIDGHMLMGQSITIIADPAGIANAHAPRDMPECPNKCMLSFANFNPTASEKLTGDMKAPPNGNLP